MLEQAEFGRKKGFKERSKQSSKQSMPAFWHSAEKINGKLDRIWEMCFFCYRQPTLMFLIGLKWMGSSRVLKWKSMWRRGTDKQGQSKTRYYFHRKVFIETALWSSVNRGWPHSIHVSTDGHTEQTVQWVHVGEEGRDREGGEKKNMELVPVILSAVPNPVETHTFSHTHTQT